MDIQEVGLLNIIKLIINGINLKKLEILNIK